MIKCVEIRTVLDIVSIKMPNTIAKNVTSTASINCLSKKVKDYNIYYLLSLCKTKMQ